MRIYKIAFEVETEKERELIEGYIRHALNLIKIKKLSVKEKESEQHF